MGPARRPSCRAARDGGETRMAYADDGGMDGAQSRRRKGPTKLSDVEIDRRVQAETLRTLSIASMRRDTLIAYVGHRITVEHMAGVPRSRVRNVIMGMIAGGTIAVYDPVRSAASGVGCPCCAGAGGAWSQYAGGGNGDDDDEKKSDPVLRLDGPMANPASHAAYCLLSAWEYEYGMMEAPSKKRFLRELCKRGGYDWEIAAESVRLLVQWRLVSDRKGEMTVVVPERRRPQW